VRAYEERNAETLRLARADVEARVPWTAEEWRGKRTLDVGCGPGGMGVWLAGRCAHVTLVDPARSMLDAARARAEREGARNVAFVHGGASPETIGRGPYDFVTASLVLHHVPDWRETLAGALAPALAPGGLLLVHEISAETVAALGHDVLVPAAGEPLLEAAAACGLERVALWHREPADEDVGGRTVRWEMFGVLFRKRE
jgi:2-polyprenyl-3-methyl-5-hydroxy-6-metoxy-1,4-benzoquinol methylase